MAYKKIAFCLMAALIAHTGLFAQTGSADSSDFDENEFYTDDFNTDIDYSIYYDDEEEEDPSEKLPDGAKDEEELIPLNDLIEGLSNGTYGRGGTGSVFVDGALGVGYPDFFKGDFNITKNTDTKPFFINFSHDSTDGYGRNFPASEGYTDSNTVLSGSFETSVERFDFRVQGDYNAVKYGLQNRALSFSAFSSEIYSGKAGITINLPKGFLLSGDVGGEWYTRYMNVISGATDYTASELSNNEFYIAPVVYAGWHDMGFLLNLGMEYDFEVITATENKKTLNRRRFFLDFGWGNSYLNILFNGGIIRAEDITALPVMPFAVLDINGEFPIGSTSRLLKANLKGGLDSYRKRFSEIEHESLFALAVSVPDETVDFFAQASIEVPIVNMFTLSAGAEFRKTAFGMGSAEADYSALSTSGSGVYSVNTFDRMLLDSEAAFLFNWQWLTVKADWKGHWMRIPNSDYWHDVGLAIEMVYPGKLFGGTISAREGLFKSTTNPWLVLDTADFWPVLSASFFYKVHSNLSIAVEIDDAMKLFSGKERIFGQTVFCKRAGTVSGLLRFSF